MTNVFVYGILLNHEWPEESVCLGPGTVADRTLRFRVYANAAACQNAVMHGVVWSVNEEELRILDDIEAVDKGLYKRTEVDVIVRGEAARAWLYEMRPPHTWVKELPHPRYIADIISAYSKYGLPQDGIKDALLEFMVPNGRR